VHLLFAPAAHGSTSEAAQLPQQNVGLTTTCRAFRFTNLNPSVEKDQDNDNSNYFEVTHGWCGAGHLSRDLCLSFELKEFKSGGPESHFARKLRKRTTTTT
jgi:hypothetical protein